MLLIKGGRSMQTHHPLQTFLVQLWMRYLAPLETFSEIYLCPELHTADRQMDAELSADSLLPGAAAAR